jgi:hypothetical protein
MQIWRPALKLKRSCIFLFCGILTDQLLPDWNNVKEADFSWTLEVFSNNHNCSRKKQVTSGDGVIPVTEKTLV